MKVVLAIAGSDSGGGAGIQADLASFRANGVYGASAITAVTAQNTVAVTASFVLPPEIVAAQIDAVLDDLPVDVVKTGTLASAAIVEVVAARIAERGPFPLVVDPVMTSKSGFALLPDDAVAVLRERLIPLATVITPNLHEAERLSGRRIHSADDAAEVARGLAALGCGAVIVKGGHLEDAAIDVLWDGHTEHRFTAARLDTKHTHGTGCTFASALAAQIARGYALPDAVARAKRYVTEAIRHGLPLGRGRGPTHHFWFLEGEDRFPYGSEQP